jgi:hypothetical protein
MVRSEPPPRAGRYVSLRFSRLALRRGRLGAHGMIAAMHALAEVDDSTGNPSAASRQVRLGAASWQFAIAAVVAFAVVALFLHPSSYRHDYVFPAGNDALWQPGMFQIHGQAGIFGTTHHLAWPVGANPWRLPQLGALIGAWAWITVGWLGLGTASSILWYLAIAAGLNAAAMVFWIRGFVGSRLSGLTLALAISIGVSVFTVTHQLNLASFFPIPLAFGFLVRIPRLSRRAKLWGSAGLAVLAFISPLWWIVVLVLMLPVLTLHPMVRGMWRQTREVALVSVTLLAGMAAQAVVLVIASSGGPGTDTARQPWNSNLFFGHMSDLFVGSPLIHRLIPGTAERLARGSSGEVSTGIPMLVLAAVALLVLLAVPPRNLRSGVDTSILAAVTVTSALFWLGGGLGNLQAAAAVLAGTTSPARVWYRMIVVLALVGAAWLALIAHEFDVRNVGRPGTARVLTGAVALFLLVGAIGDLAAYRQPRYSSANGVPQATGAVRFLLANEGPCAVAQFPNEAIPNGRIKTGIADPAAYRGMVPFVVAPEFYWSAGSYDTAHPSGIAELGGTVTNADIARLRDWGYCAVLYDKTVGSRALAQNADLAGRQISFNRPPDYQDSVYSVYLLTST